MPRVILPLHNQWVKAGQSGQIWSNIQI